MSHLWLTEAKRMEFEPWNWPNAINVQWSLFWNSLKVIHNVSPKFRISGWHPCVSSFWGVWFLSSWYFVGFSQAKCSTNTGVAQGTGYVVCGKAAPSRPVLISDWHHRLFVSVNVHMSFCWPKKSYYNHCLWQTYTRFRYSHDLRLGDSWFWTVWLRFEYETCFLWVWPIWANHVFNVALLIGIIQPRAPSLSPRSPSSAELKDKTMEVTSWTKKTEGNGVFAEPDNPRCQELFKRESWYGWRLDHTSIYSYYLL